VIAVYDEGFGMRSPVEPEERGRSVQRVDDHPCAVSWRRIPSADWSPTCSERASRRCASVTARCLASVSTPIWRRRWGRACVRR